MKLKMIKAHLDVAQRYAELSKAQRLKVGAIVVKNDRIISIGYNGTAPGDDNNCEDIQWMPRDTGGWLNPDEIYQMYPLVGEHPEYGQWHYRLKTRDNVIHAEENAIAKLARSHESGEGATLFITHAPCQQCSKLILQSGIIEVWYARPYRSDDGIKYLRTHGVSCHEYRESNNANYAP
jgi:dCMP deaminase